ncbi:MAG: polysaccharide deacetylase family protein [Bacteroidales bacterium]
MIRFYRPLFLQRVLMSGALFRLDTDGRKEVALTFDDGPHPDSTPDVLEILGKENIVATFFCNGDNCRRYAYLHDNILTAGHRVGNHGYNHLKGLETSTSEYVRDVQMAAEVIDGDLFRPPYGSITRMQYKMLKRNFMVIMWDLMPYDFDHSLSAGHVKRTILGKVRPGSIIVLHDSPASHTLTMLQETISDLKVLGYSFVCIP